MKYQEQITKILGNVPDLKHPYADQSLSGAILIVLNGLSLSFREDSCQSLKDVLTHLHAMHPGHTWITGQYAGELVRMGLMQEAGYAFAAKGRKRNPGSCPVFFAISTNRTMDRADDPLSLSAAWYAGYDRCRDEKAAADKTQAADA